MTVEVCRLIAGTTNAAGPDMAERVDQVFRKRFGKKATVSEVC